DGGATFERAGEYPSDDGYSGDVALAATDEGDAYLVWIDYYGRPEAVSDLYAVATHDHGESWGEPVRVAEGDDELLVDRPWVAVGPDGTVHVKWMSYVYNGTYEEMWIGYTRSGDGGVTFDPPDAFDVSDLANYDDYTYSNYALAVAADGDVLVSEQFLEYESGNSLASSVRLGRLEGDEFDSDEIAETYYSRDLKLNAYPMAAAAPTGRVCFAYLDALERDIDLYVAVADDGEDFDPPETFESGVGSTQALPWIAADADGRCHLIWLDNRSGDWEVWAATVRPDGTRSPIERVSDASFTEDGSPEQWLGDMNSIAVGGSMRYAVWTDTREGESAIYFSTSPIEGP
ncbi:MAG: hypothetical protein AABZ30_13675, partial [Myxococcota bacterium]